MAVREPATYEQALERISELEEQLESLDDSIQERLHENKVWRDREDLLRSVPGVGKVLARTLIIDLPELGILDRRRIAALVGIAPFNRDSGHSVGKRRISGGRASIRGALYMACVASLKWNPIIRAFYTKLRATKPAFAGCPDRPDPPVVNQGVAQPQPAQAGFVVVATTSRRGFTRRPRLPAP